MFAEKHSRTLACLELALFTFVFLDGEFVFDTVIGCLVSAHDVVAAESTVLAASAIGFLALPLAQRLVRRKASRTQATGIVTPAVLGIATFAAYAPIAWAPVAAGFGSPLFASAPTTLALGCAAFALLGVMGAAAHLHAAYAFAGSARTARAVGLSYAAGLLVQFAFNSLLGNACAEAAALCLALCALAACLCASGQTHIQVETKNMPAPQKTARERLLLLVAVVLMACVFCTLNNAVTLAHAQGAISVEAPPRLLLAASGVLAGFAFDAHGRKHMPLTMLCVTMLSVLSLLAMLAGFSNLVGLSVFYLASGFFVVFFTTSFLDVAPESPHPALWAGMGRAANNLCAGIIALPSLNLVQAGNVMATATFACVMFVAITVVVYNLVVPRILAEAQTSKTKVRENRESEASSTAGTIDARENTQRGFSHERGQNVLPATGAEESTRTVSHEQLLARFCERYQLTPREADVLGQVCSNERTLRELSEEMGISQRMLQRHLTSIYRKTGTQTRAGLTSMLLKGN